MMQIYRSCYGNSLTRNNGKDDSHHQRCSHRLDKGNELKHASSGRGLGCKEHREDRYSNGERVNRTFRIQLSSQEDSRGHGEPRKAVRDTRRSDFPVWTNATLKKLSCDGSMEWETFIHRFKLVAYQMGLDDREKVEFLVSTIQGGSFKAIMYAQRDRGELSFMQ